MYIVDWMGKSTGQIFRTDDIVVSVKTRYQTVVICILKDWGKALFIDGELQSTQRDCELYHSVLTLPALRLTARKGRVLVIGGGEGATAKYALKSARKVTMVDLDRELVNACKINLPEFHEQSFSDKRLNLRFSDGLEFIEESKEVYDVIIVDASDPGRNPVARSVYSRDFYIDCAQKLAQGGVLVTQAGSTIYRENTFESVVKRIKNVGFNVYPYEAWIPSYGSPWGFIVATSLPLPPPTVSEAILSVEGTRLVHAKPL